MLRKLSWETIPFLCFPLFLPLNAVVDNSVEQWTKHSRQEEQVPDWTQLRGRVARSRLLLSVSLVESGCCVPWKALLVHRSGTGNHFLEEEDGQLGLSGRSKTGHRQNRIQLFCWPEGFFFMQEAFQVSLKPSAEMNPKCLPYAFSALSSNYDNLGGYVNYTILVKWYNYEMLRQKQKRNTLP